MPALGFSHLILCGHAVRQTNKNPLAFMACLRFQDSEGAWGFLLPEKYFGHLEDWGQSTLWSQGSIRQISLNSFPAPAFCGSSLVMLNNPESTLNRVRGSELRNSSSKSKSLMLSWFTPRDLLWLLRVPRIWTCSEHWWPQADWLIWKMPKPRHINARW